MLVDGTRLGPYEILGQIGAGGMGVVYRAKDKRLGRDVAIKVLQPSFSESPERLRRFEQEAKTISSLNHPNVLAIFDMGTHEGSPYLVMELLEGETLRERMNARPLPPRKAVEIVQSIAQGLAAAHDKGVIHRDLKPENIFLTRDGRLKILDFGLAKLLSGHSTSDDGEGPTRALDLRAHLTQEGFVIGTVGYMSPEQVRAEPLDERSDLFSVGVILWEMLTGQRPFRGDSAVETMHAILKDEPPELDPELKIPPHLERILARCLAKEPSGRFRSAGDLAFALEGAVGSGYSSSMVAKAQPRASRKLLGLFVGIPAGLIALAVLLALAFTTPPEPIFKRVAFRRGKVQEARFTPDGRGFIYSISDDGTSWQTFLVALETLREQPTGPANAQILSLSRSGELAMSLGVQPVSQGAFSWAYTGILSKAPQLGAIAPKELLEDVEWADYAQDGRLAVVRNMEGHDRLECPVGTVRVETAGWFSHPRFSPNGDAIAYLEHTSEGDDHGRLALLELKTGRTRALTKVWSAIRGVAWKGDQIWFTADEAGCMCLFSSTRSGKLRSVLRAPGDLVLHDISADGRVLLARDDIHIGLITQATGMAKPLEFSQGAWSHVSDLSADGQTIVFEEMSEQSENGYHIYLRKQDSPQSVLLGSGEMAALSPDRAWVAAIQVMPAPHPVLFPTGLGEPKHLPALGLGSYSGLAWTGEGKLLVSGNLPGKGNQVFLQDPDLGTVKALTKEGVFATNTSLLPDGLHFLAETGGEGLIYDLRKPLDPPSSVQGFDVKEQWIGRCSDSRHLLVARPVTFPVEVWKLDTVTGRREKAPPLAPAGFHGVPIFDLILSVDGLALAATYFHYQSDLFVVEGLK